MPKGKEQEQDWSWSVPELATLCNVSESYLYRMIREFRMIRDSAGMIDGFNSTNIGMLTKVLPVELLYKYDAAVRERYNLKPPPKV